MPIIMPIWSNKTDLATDASLAGANATMSRSLNLAAIDYEAAEIQIKIVHNASADAGCTVEFFRSNDSGSTLDTVSLYPIFTVHTTNYIRTFTFTDLTFLSIKVTNASSSAAHTATVTITYRGKNWVIN
jgi:hypothetical protein